MAPICLLVQRRLGSTRPSAQSAQRRRRPHKVGLGHRLRTEFAAKAGQITRMRSDLPCSHAITEIWFCLSHPHLTHCWGVLQTVSFIANKTRNNAHAQRLPWSVQQSHCKCWLEGHVLDWLWTSPKWQYLWHYFLEYKAQPSVLVDLRTESWEQIAPDLASSEREQTTTKPTESAKLNERAKSAKLEPKDHN